MTSVAINNAPPDITKRPRENMAVATRNPGPEKAVLAMNDESDMRSKRTNKRTWDYIWRSGVAGGLAGCAVSDARNGDGTYSDGDDRPKQSSLLWIESRYSFRRRIRSSPNTRDHGLVSHLP